MTENEQQAESFLILTICENLRNLRLISDSYPGFNIARYPVETAPQHTALRISEAVPEMEKTAWQAPLNHSPRMFNLLPPAKLPFGSFPRSLFTNTCTYSNGCAMPIPAHFPCRTAGRID